MSPSRREALFGLSGLAAAGAGGIASLRQGAATDGVEGAGGDLQRRYDALANAGGGTLELPAGTFPASLNMHSRTVHLRGAGRDATVLTPRDAGVPVLQPGYSTGTWDAVTISDLTIRGPGGGTGLGYGDADDDRFAGRTILRNVKFYDLEKCISRPTGNIGLYLEDCQFEDADYHLWGKSRRAANGEIMHNGVLSARRCHFQRATKAVLYVDSDVAGSGQINFDQCIFESNPGFVLAVARFESRDAVPGIVVRSCWNEANATGGGRSSLALGGREREPVFLFADRVASIEFHDTPPGRMVLLGDTTVTTRLSALDLLEVAHADPAANLSHHEARIFGDKVVDGLTYSLSNANQKNMGPTGAIFQLPHRGGVVRPELAGAHDVNACRAPFVVDGSRRTATTSFADAILPGAAASQQLDMRAGDEFFVNAIRIPAPGFIAWTFAYRLAGGQAPDFQVSGRAAISTVTPLESPDWATLGGVAFVDRPLDQLGFLLQASKLASVRLGGFQLVSFPTRQAATEMLNDRLFRDRPDGQG